MELCTSIFTDLCVLEVHAQACLAVGWGGGGGGGCSYLSFIKAAAEVCSIEREIPSGASPATQPGGAASDHHNPLREPHGSRSNPKTLTAGPVFLSETFYYGDEKWNRFMTKIAISNSCSLCWGTFRSAVNLFGKKKTLTLYKQRKNGENTESI